jgi:hypothetical protein
MQVMRAPGRSLLMFLVLGAGVRLGVGTMIETYLGLPSQCLRNLVTDWIITFCLRNKNATPVHVWLRGC